MAAAPSPTFSPQSSRVPTPADFSAALRQYWGYDSFRPGQESIITSIAAGRDACVVMPTGGGKSLCYQLPAALDRQRTAVVVSPLIALMQDQVVQLRQMDISAGFLNSSLSTEERKQVLAQACQGRYRLLYLSPERIALDGTPAWLGRIPLSFFAIDEAHCISEWGHDFRPEYRQLKRLRELFPEVPIAAFTASATQHVRHDIVEQLQLRDPFKHIASFRRPNLRYQLRQCDGQTQNELLLRAVKQYSNESVIIYSGTVARVGEIVDLLEEHGIAAIGYHGQMESAARRMNQEKWMADEVRVMVGTLAFGLGINKPSVRAVIHLALPKSVEQYYQESGRAGRDGRPADCYLFWQKKDASLHAFFINQIADAGEKARAWQRYHEIENFVQSRDCRQDRICRHFGESPKWDKCGLCDCCATQPSWMEIETVRRKAGSRRPSQQAPLLAAANVPNLSVDSELKEFIREWRRNTAKEKGVAAFVVMHDSSLEDLCLVEPSTLQELRRVSGFGQKKVELYGNQILQAIRKFREGARAQSDGKAKSVPPSEETLTLLEQGHTFEEIAKIRGRKLQSVVALVADLIERGQLEFEPEWLLLERYDLIVAACQKHGFERLKPVKDSLPADFTYDEIRLVVAHLRTEATSTPKKN